MTPRDLAYAAFWTDHPLCDLFRFVRRREAIPLRDLIAFAESLPASVVARLSA